MDSGTRALTRTQAEVLPQPSGATAAVGPARCRPNSALLPSTHKIERSPRPPAPRAFPKTLWQYTHGKSACTYDSFARGHPCKLCTSADQHRASTGDTTLPDLWFAPRRRRNRTPSTCTSHESIGATPRVSRMQLCCNIGIHAPQPASMLDTSATRGAPPSCSQHTTRPICHRTTRKPEGRIATRLYCNPRRTNRNDKPRSIDRICGPFAQGSCRMRCKTLQSKPSNVCTAACGRST